MSFRDAIVNKPWGFEYLAYESDDIALWVLHIEKGMSTSLHAHPAKTTGFVLLQGQVRLSFLADSKVVSAPDKQMIRRGLFHQTTALTDNVILLEVESPNDKADLVRLTDPHGRSADGYERSSAYTARGPEHPWIDLDSAPMNVNFGAFEREVEVVPVDSLSEFSSFGATDIVMFLHGGVGKVVDGRRHMATVPGDVGRFEVLSQVVDGMEFVAPNTWVMRVK